MFALPLNTLAGDSDFTYTALSNDAANNRTGQSIRTSFESRLPGYLNFGNDSSRKRGREDGDEQSLESEWRVALHKILINNYPENSPVMKVFRDDNSLVHCEQLPLGYYPNWNSVLRQTYDLLRITLSECKFLYAAFLSLSSTFSITHIVIARLFKKLSYVTLTV